MNSLTSPFLGGVWRRGLGAVGLLVLASLPVRAWFHNCDSLAAGAPNATSPLWTSAGADPAGTLSIYGSAGYGFTCLVATCTNTATHAQVERHQCSPFYPAMGLTNTFTLDIKFPTANANGITQTFFQIYEQGPNGSGGWQWKPILMVLRDGPSGKLFAKFVHAPSNVSDDELWDLGPMAYNQWFSIKFQIEFQKTAGKGWVKVWWGPKGGTQTYFYRQENVCYFGDQALKLYSGYGNYTYGTAPFTGIANVDNVWIEKLW